MCIFCTQSPWFSFGSWNTEIKMKWNKKPACQTEIPLQAAEAPLLFCIADFTWALCQDTVYIISTEKCFKLKASQDPQLSQSGIWRLNIPVLFCMSFPFCLYPSVSFHVKFSNWHKRSFCSFVSAAVCLELSCFSSPSRLLFLNRSFPPSLLLCLK